MQESKKYSFGERKRPNDTKISSSIFGDCKRTKMLPMITTGKTMRLNQNDSSKPAATDLSKSSGDLSRCIFTGTADSVLKWFNLIETHCLYEVISPIKNLAYENNEKRVLILRGNCGPVLKLVYYSSDQVNLPNFNLGLWIRCVGTKSFYAENSLRAVSIREATPREISSLPRITYLSEQQVNSMIKDSA